MSDVQVGQIYSDNDPRMEGRTLKVIANPDLYKVTMEVVSNPHDIQRLLDDTTPGTRSYKPKDRRGKRTEIDIKRLGSTAQRGFTLISTQVNGS